MRLQHSSQLRFSRFVVVQPLFIVAPPLFAAERWTPQQANEWYDAAALAGRLQLPAEQRDQPARNVAAGNVRPDDDRSRIGLGRVARLQHGSRVSAQSAVARRSRRIPQEHRQVSGNRGQAQNPADDRVLRRRLGSRSAKRQAESAASRRTQQRLGPKPGPHRACRQCEAGCARVVRHGCSQALRERQARARLGLVQRAGQPQRQQLRPARIEEQGRSGGAARARNIQMGTRGRAFAAANRVLVGPGARLGRGRYAQQGASGCRRTERRHFVSRLWQARFDERPHPPACANTSARSFAPSSWPAATAARSKRFCRS